MPCDICNKNDNHAKTVPANKIKKAIQNGFDPFSLGIAPKPLAMQNNTNKEIFFEWKLQSMMDTSDWLICPSCLKILSTFLESDSDSDIIRILQRHYPKLHDHSQWNPGSYYEKEGDHVTEITLIRESGNLPNIITNLKHLRKLQLLKTSFNSLPNDMTNLSSLRELWIEDQTIDKLPKSLGQLKSLYTLNIDLVYSRPKKTCIPESIGNLKSLHRLYLLNGRFVIPSSFKNLTSLKTLEINRITENLKNIEGLPSLTNLKCNIYSKNDSSIKFPKNLEFLNIYTVNIPESIKDLKKLVGLTIKTSDITEIPEFLAELPKLKYLSFDSRKKIKQVPEKFLDNTVLESVQLSKKIKKSKVVKQLIKKNLIELCEHYKIL